MQREAATSKIRDRRARMQPGLKLLWRMAFAMSGEAKRGASMKLNWGPIEFVSLAEQTSADSQAVSLSTVDRLERFYHYSPNEADRNMQRLTAEKLLAASLAPQPQPPGGGGQPGSTRQQQPGAQPPERQAGAA